VKTISANLTDLVGIKDAIAESAPDEIYNLGAVSFVGLSFEEPELTANVTGLGVLRVLQSIRALGLEEKVRLYQASSSEMFGEVAASPQNEKTPFTPRTPYGIAKTFAHYTCAQYREAYGIHVSCGILYNHEGEHRRPEFVTRKITSNVAKIALGKQERFSLGNLHARRDWGYAGDYVRAIWAMLQHDQPQDFVVATGKSHSVADFVKTSLEVAGLDPDIEKYVDFDKTQMRPSDSDKLVGDATKAREVLGWEPTKDFNQLVSLMVENDLRIESEG
jgi:GDPmannose 4,6-dehydratase